MRILIRLWWAGFLALASGSKAGDAVEVNVISKVEVRGTAVEIAGNRKPNFTTFTMADPPRLVIDISEAVFSKVPEEIQVRNGTVRTVKTAGYGTGSSAIARVIIGFERNVETDIANLGDTSLLVKILGEGGPAVAEVPKPPQAAPDKTVKAPERGKQETPAAAQAPAPAKPDVAQVNQKAEQERLHREEQEKEAKRREAETKRAVELKAQEEERQKRLAEIEEKKRLEEEKKRLENEARIAEAKAKKEQLRVAAEEKQKKEEEARLAKELERERARAEEERRKQEAAEKKKELEEARLAKQIEAQERAKEQEERRRQAVAEKQSKREAAVLAERIEQERANPEKNLEVGVKVAKASSHRSDAAEAPTLRHRPSSGARRLVTFVGFTNQASGSRVFVRTSGPVQFSVAEGKDKTVILELENARIGLRNNSRPLDTSQFDSAVTMVKPNQTAGEKVQVQIRLKDPVPYRAKQEGNEVVLDFGPPPHP